MISEEYYKSWRYRLKKPIQRLWFKFRLFNGDIINVGEKERGIGKTTLLVNRAKKHNYSIVVGSGMHKQYVLNMDSTVRVYTANEALNRGFRADVLFDETVSSEQMDYAINHNNVTVRGGFRYKRED